MAAELLPQRGVVKVPAVSIAGGSVVSKSKKKSRPVRQFPIPDSQASLFFRDTELQAELNT